MKAEAGWGAAALVAAAAVVGVNYHSSGKSDTGVAGGGRQGHHSTTPGVAMKSAFDRGPCVDLETRIQTFLLTSQEGIAAPPSCYDEPTDEGRKIAAGQDSKGATDLRAKAQGLQYVIATLPDPLHTHFALSFDRQAEAIQQGAQDEGYYYDSSWLPWETEEKPLVLLADQDKAEDETKDREDQPGILLFRKKPRTSGCKPPEPPAAQPYCDGLVVFVVGEEPTGGIHKRQFQNAFDWIAALQPRTGNTFVPLQKPVKLLGPTFSGSLPSLAQLLAEEKRNGNIASLHAALLDKTLPIFSGGVSDNALVNWFVDPARQIGDIEFRSFQQDGDTLLDRYRRYLDQQGVEQSRLAILSEDETAYGGFGGKDAGPLCRPLVSPGQEPPAAQDPDPPVDDRREAPACLYYPRDISALRAAYQKEGIFNAASSQQSTEASQKQLSSDLADPEGKEHDTIRNYAGDQAALSQEAALKQIVSSLQAHRSEYIVLRSSNPLDQLFLSHFLRLAYPEGRIVIEGSDLLLRRENGAAALSGIMTLTTYPLLTWADHWVAAPSAPPYLHGHRVFNQELAEGTYVATRFLLDKWCPDCLAKSKDIFVPPNCEALEIPDYAAPFWVRTEAAAANSRRACELPRDSRRPSIWLSVLGRDGFWPVAALNALDQAPAEVLCLSKKPDSTQSNEPIAWAEQSALGAVESLGNLVMTVAHPQSHPSEEVYNGWPEWPPMPLSMKICLLAILLAGIFHLHCCLRASPTVKPMHRAFARTYIDDFQAADRSRRALILIGSVIVTLVPIIMAWGYGAMSISGEPVPHAWAYRIFLPFIWILGGTAIAANAWVESEYYLRAENPPWSGVKQWLARRASDLRRLVVWRRYVLKSILKPLFWYLVATVLCYLVAAFFLEGSLWDANRFPAYWRSIHLTTGVSPLVPLLALTVGLYFWFWYSLQGLAFFGGDRPQLPSEASLLVALPNDPRKLPLLCMFSSERAAAPIEALCGPFALGFGLVALVAFIFLWVVGVVAGGAPPIRGLGAKPYSVFFCFGLDLCISLMLANAWQLLKIWLRLRQLLLFLDRVPLRRTMEALKDITWGSIWKMGGSVLDLRYRMLSRQMESLTHLQNALQKEPIPAGASAWSEQIVETQKAQFAFAEWYAKKWDNWKVRDLTALHRFQCSVAKTSGMLISEPLVDYWLHEEESLVVDLSEKIGGGEKDGEPNSVIKLPDHIRNAEKLVCLVYVGFIQNILGRMRTLAMQMLWLFVAVSISLATYPFDPRPALSGTLFALFLILGTVIVIVYSQMHRDATLSLITNTNPGELGAEFWFKLIGFAAGPVLGLLATIFPEVTGSLFSWLQPGLESIK